jgi:GNAT superfamily N-acetyltransferase
VAEIEAGARIQVEDYRRLRESVGWGTPDGDDAIQSGLDVTWNVVAREGGEIVGIGRLLDEGALYAALWDMIVVPHAQRRGIGSAILDQLLERAAERTIVVLVATAAGRPLYERHGFRTESFGGIGMILRPGG